MKKYLLIFGISFVFFWGLAALRGGYVTICGITGFRLSALVGLLVMWAWSCFSLVKFKQLKPIYVILAIWLGISIFEVLARLLSSDTLISLPTYLLWNFGMAIGYLSYLLIKKGTRYKPLLATLMAVLLFVGIWCALYGYNLYTNKLSFGTYTGRLSEHTVAIPIEFQDKDGATVKLTDLPEEYLIFDVWSSSCGVCYKKFPTVQQVYDTYKDDDRVGLYGIHGRVADKETVATGSDILASRGYTFPNLSIDIDAPVLKELGVDGFPNVLIFDRNRNLIFRGNIEFAEKFISKKLSEND